MAAQGRLEAKLWILSWSINGFKRHKLSNNDFLDKLYQNDIIFLYESWANEHSDFDVNGYTCYNIFRKFQSKNAKRGSGDIVLYGKDTISKGCKKYEE